MRRPAAIGVLAAALALAAACTGGAERATETATASAPHDRLALAERLPPEDAVPGLAAGAVRELDNAGALARVLYAPGDPAIPGAAARFEEAGFDGAALRDQQGTDPSTGLRLLRSYAVRLGSAEAARREVDTSVDEVAAATEAPGDEVAVEGVPGARGLAVEVSLAGRRATGLFVTFPGGPYLYGLQAFALDDAALPRDEILAAARDLHERVSAVP